MEAEGFFNAKLGELFSNRREKGKSGLPTLSVMIDGGLQDRESLDRKMETTLAPEEHLLVRPGDIAYNMMRMWQGASGLASVDAIVSPAYVVLTPTPRIDPSFAAYFFKSARMIYLFWAYSHGLTKDRLRLYFDDFAQIPVSIPSIAQQRRIAKILTTWDSAVERLEKLADNTATQKRALVLRLLTGGLRLKGFEEPWEEARLGDLGLFRKGKGISREQVSTTGYPCVRYGEIYTDHHDFIKAFHSFVPPQVAAESERISKGELLFAASGETAEEIGKCVAFLGDEEAYAGGDIIIFTPTGHDSKFLAYLLNSPELVAKKSRVGQGKSVVHISAANLGALSLKLPPIAEQRAISSFFSVLDQEQANLRQQAALLLREKNALMQQLLTGKRLVDAQEMAA